MPSNHLILCRPFFLLLSIFPSITVFSSELFFASGGQSVGVSASAPILPMNIQDWFSLGLTFRFDLLVVQGTLKSLLQHHHSKASILWCSAFFTVQLSHPYRTTGKAIALTRQAFIGKVMSLLLNMLSRLGIAFLPRHKRLLISWLQSPSAVILEPKKISVSLFPLFPHLFAMKWWDQMPWSSFFERWVLSQLFQSPLSLSSRASLVLLCFLPWGWYHLHIWGYWYFSRQSWFQLELHQGHHFTWCNLHREVGTVLFGHQSLSTELSTKKMLHKCTLDEGDRHHGLCIKGNMKVKLAWLGKVLWIS